MTAGRYQAEGLIISEGRRGARIYFEEDGTTLTFARSGKRLNIGAKIPKKTFR